MMRYSFILFLSVLIATSCSSKKEKTLISANGTWESVGSGWVLQIKDSTHYSLYDRTSISCLPNRKGPFQDLEKHLQLQEDTLVLKTGVIRYKFIKRELPQLCQEPATNKNQDPLYNFEVFAASVKEHYAFLELNNIHWEDLYLQQKSKLTKHSNEATLYQVLEETLELLNDNHAYLEATDEVYAAIDQLTEKEEEETNTETLTEYGDFQVAQQVAAHHMMEEMTKDSWLIQWGKMTKDIGFIQIKAMWLYADLDIPKQVQEEMGFVDAFIETKHKNYTEEAYALKEQEGVRSIMNRAMKDLAAMDAIVIDLRFNGGGQDLVSFEILSQFISGNLKVATQKLRYKRAYSPVLPLYIKGKGAAFTKPIYVLTSPQTGSAAEVFSIATIAMDSAKRIGSATSGALSTELAKTLPNGWHFSISNELYMDTNGKNYENIGIPVHYELHYPKDRQTFFRSVVNDLEADKRTILEAIDTLKEQ